MERLRRQKVLKDLNSRLIAGSKVGLSITGRGISAQGPQAKPSRIPTPESSSRPLPPLGYVAESICLHHTPRQRPPDVEAPPTTQTPHETRPTKTITVKIHGNVSKNNPSKASRQESRLSATHYAVVKPRQHSNSENRKKELNKVTNSDKHSATTKQTKVHAAHKRSSSWGNGGRLNELRIRFLARKYHRLWCRYVYGRTSPSQARTHRECFLKRLCLASWREIWWVARREWKLNIRAECHNRYRLWQKVWMVWTEYVHQSKLKRRKKVLAQALASKRLLGRVWGGWRQYVLIRREKRKVEVHVEQWSVMRTKKTVWHKWKTSLNERRQISSMNTLALHHWAIQLQKSALYRWLQCYHERVLLRQRSTDATLHWRRKVIGQCLRAWVSYVYVRRVKHQMRGVAGEHHNLVLATRTFGHWKQQYTQARQLADFEELVSIKGRLATLRRAVGAWKLYVNQNHYKHHNEELASQFYRLMLKLKVLRVLQVYVNTQQKQAINNKIALQFHAKKRISHSWVVWLQRCEHCEEIKLGPKTRSARAQHACKLKKKAVAAWLQYTGWRLERKKLYSRADEHFKSVALPKCVSAFKMYVSIQHHLKQLKEQSCSFRRETLLSMAFYRWWREAQLSQDVRMLQRVAVLHSEEVSKKQLLKLWRSRTKERIRHQHNEQRALTHHYYILVGGAFHKWKLTYQNSIRLERKVKRASEHCGHKLVEYVWTSWRKYVAKKRISHIKKANAIKHTDRILLKKTLVAWKFYRSNALAKKCKVLKADLIYQIKLKRKAFICFSEGIQICKSRHRLVQQATILYGLSVLSKNFSTWRKKAAEAIDQQQAEDGLLQEASVQLQHLKLARLFSTWRKYVSLSVTRRQLEEAALLHHSRVVLIKCFTAWYEHHRLHVRKTLLQRQGQWFEQTRLLSLTYSKWRIQLMHTLVLKKKNSIALWHWSQTLERKLLTAWLLYVLQKKRKRGRYCQAMERHRKRLVTIGVRQWIRVASQVQMQREETALQQQLTTTQTVMNCARKCAQHWRRVVRERKLRATQAVTLPVTFIPLQPQVLANKPQTSSQDLWNNLARQLNIPDGICLSRPQPRRSTYLSHSPYPNDAIPRVPSHPPPTLHPLLSDTVDAAKKNDTFTSHSASCIAETELVNSTKREHSQNTIESSVSVTMQPMLNLSSVIDRQDQDQIRDRGQHGTNFHQSIPFPPMPSFDRHKDTLECSSTLPHMSCSAEPKPSQEADLSNPSVQMEIVQMRDELKRFHDLKVHHKQLEAQLTARAGQGDSGPISELEQELKATSEKIKQCAPVVHVIAAKVQQLLSQS